MFTCKVGEAGLCDAIMNLNAQGYTVVKTKLLDKRVHELYFRVRAKVISEYSCCIF